MRKYDLGYPRFLADLPYVRHWMTSIEPVDSAKNKTDKNTDFLPISKHRSIFPVRSLKRKPHIPGTLQILRFWKSRMIINDSSTACTFWKKILKKRRKRKDIEIQKKIEILRKRSMNGISMALCRVPIKWMFELTVKVHNLMREEIFKRIYKQIAGKKSTPEVSA